MEHSAHSNSPNSNARSSLLSEADSMRENVVNMDDVLAASANQNAHGHAHNHRTQQARPASKYGFLMLPACIACLFCLVSAGLLIMFIFGSLCLARSNDDDTPVAACAGGGRTAGYAMTVIGGIPYCFVVILLSYNSLYFFCCPDCWTRRFKEISL